jgi:hypothetical protein
MVDTDIAWWSAKGTSSEMEDLYARDEVTPIIDTVNTYNTTFEVLNDGSVNFKSTRKLDTG